MASRLVDPGLGTLELSPANGYAVKEVDLGYPAAREVSADRVDANGTEDHTAFYGARAVSLTMSVWPGPARTANRRAALDRLRAFAAPGRRPVLYFNDDDLAGEPDRMVRLRGDQLSGPLTNPVLSVVQVQWVAPDGVVEAVDLSVAEVPAGSTDEQGITFPVTFPIVFPLTPPTGEAQVDVGGTTDAWPIIRLYGPCTDPKIENTTAGWALEFTDLSLAAGDYLELDTRARTVLLNGTVSRYANLDFAASSWGPLAPAVNEIRYYPAAFSGAALAQLRFRTTYI